MLNIKTEVKNLDALKNHLAIVKGLQSMVSDKKLQTFIKQKCLEAVRQVTEERLVGGTTDDEYIEEYKNNHQIADTANGFVLYNNTTIPTEMLPISEQRAGNYPNGFNIALAFEYGIGIVGENAPVEGAWKYNVNNWNFAWYYQKDGQLYSTYGYAGFEIYRFTAERIKQNLSSWIVEYQNRKSGVST